MPAALSRDSGCFGSLVDNPDSSAIAATISVTHDPGSLRKALQVDHGLFVECNLSANGIRDTIRRLLATFRSPRINSSSSSARTGTQGVAIMEREELRRLVDQVRQRKMEPDAVEVKAAHVDTPKVYDSLAAFGNRPGGGVLLLGLDERQGFNVVGVGNTQKVQSDIANCARDQMEPPLNLLFTVDEIEGLTVMAVEVSEVPNEQKPCYYKAKGLKGNGGAYLRSGGTDRPMTDYEIFTYISSRGQPRNDEEPVKEATREDLDRDLVHDYLQKIRRSRSRSRILEGSDADVLTRLHLCCRDGDICGRPWPVFSCS